MALSVKKPSSFPPACIRGSSPWLRGVLPCGVRTFLPRSRRPGAILRPAKTTHKLRHPQGQGKVRCGLLTSRGFAALGSARVRACGVWSAALQPGSTLKSSCPSGFYATHRAPQSRRDLRVLVRGALARFTVETASFARITNSIPLQSPPVAPRPSSPRSAAFTPLRRPNHLVRLD